MTPEFRRVLYLWKYDAARDGDDKAYCIPYQLQVRACVSIILSPDFSSFLLHFFPFSIPHTYLYIGLCFRIHIHT